MSGIVHYLFPPPPQRDHNMNVLFILIDDKLDAHYIISEDVNNKEERGK
jgi:hypothetical protein